MDKDVVRPYLVLVNIARCDYDEERDALSVYIEGTRLSFMDGEPEDNNISRNFSDVERIGEAIKEAHKAGLEGRPLNLVVDIVDWYDF